MMKKKIAWLMITGILSAGLLIGCTNQTPEGPPEQIEEPTPGEEESQLPDSREETIVIEGMEEKITTYFYNGDLFTTYVPEDLAVAYEDSDMGDIHWFYANYQGNKLENVFLQMVFLPEDVKEQPSLAGENSILPFLGIDLASMEVYEDGYPWAIEALRGIQRGTYAYLGENEGRYFVFVLQYPVEYAEGFRPRVNKVLENFQWTETKAPLALNE